MTVFYENLANIAFASVKFMYYSATKVMVLAVFLAGMMWAWEVSGATVLEAIAAAIQSGNSKQLAQHFDNNVDITVYNKEETYSKTQGELVMRDFFAKNTPVSFKIIHKGSSSQGSEYAIGTLTTNVGSFRTYIYIKQKGSLYLIQEIRFEKD